MHQAKAVQGRGAARPGDHSHHLGIAGIKAVILAKFMLVGRMLHIGERFRDKPLIWPTLHYALMTLIVLLILATAEELIVGWIHSRTVGDSPYHPVGPIFFEGIADSLIMFLIFVPFSVFTCLFSVLGEREVFWLFLLSRTVDANVRDRLAGHLPPAHMSG